MAKRKTEIAQELPDVVEAKNDTLDVRLMRWANRYGLAQSPSVQMLAGAIQDGRNTEFWGTVNMLDVLPAPRYEGNTKRERLALFLLTLRNVLVFVPVALTWAGISQATSAFGTFSAQNQATTVNFLSFWQDGYGYLAPFWHIDAIAQFDVLVVLAVIGLTLFVSRINHSNDLIFTSGMNRAEEERLSIAMELQNYFHARREITDKTVTQTVASSVAGLRDMTRDMSNAMTDLRKVMQNFVDDTMPKVNGVGSDLAALTNSATDRIEILVEKLSAGVVDTQAALSAAGKNLNSVGIEAAQIIKRIAEIEQTVNKAGSSVTDTVSKFETAVSKTKKEIDSNIADTVEKTAKSMDKLSRELDGTSKKLQSNANSIGDQIEKLKSSLKRKNILPKDE